MNVSGILNHILKRPCPQMCCLVTSHRYLSWEQLTNLAYQEPNSGNYYKGPHSSRWKHSPLPAHPPQMHLFPPQKQTFLGQSKCLDWTVLFRSKKSTSPSIPRRHQTPSLVPSQASPAKFCKCSF